jgi:hypothetical protein
MDKKTTAIVVGHVSYHFCDMILKVFHIKSIRIIKMEDNKMKRMFLFLVSVYLIFSCAGSSQKGLTLYGEKRIIESDFTRLFNATRDYLLERGYKIIKTNFETGEIETEYRNGSGWTYAGFSGTDRRAKVKAKVVKNDETNSTLTIDIYSEVRSLEAGWQMVPGDTRDARIMYDRFFEGISAKAQGRRIRE